MSRIRGVAILANVFVVGAAWAADTTALVLGAGQGGQAENRVLSEKIKQGDHVAVLARDLGGVAQLTKFLTQPDRDAIGRTLTSYGVKFVDLDKASSGRAAIEESRVTPAASPSDADLSSCVMFYPLALHNTVFAQGQSVLSIDAQGRAGIATWDGGPTTPPSPGARTSCQTIVGGWGIYGDQGGHLIPSALGGSPWRLNLTPQNGNLNQGAWASYIEGAAVYCSKYSHTSYSVMPVYPTDTDVRPSGYSVLVTTQLNPKGGFPESEDFSWGAGVVPNRVLTDDEKNMAKTFYAEYKCACSIETLNYSPGAFCSV